jgi:peptide/nickel transport system permease protein
VTRFVATRVLWCGVSLLALVTIVFGVTRLTGDPATTLLPVEATREEVATLRALYGLDRPLVVQYALFLRHAAAGDLGMAFYWNRPVTELLWLRLPASLELTAAAMVLGVGLAVPLGVYAAVGRGGWRDLAIRVLAVAGSSAPAFWVGLVLIQLFAVWLRVLPPGGREGVTTLLMPAVTLALLVSASIVRLMRSTMLEVLDSEYIKFARIKGLPERRVIWRHAVRNALLPVVTYSAVVFATLLGGAVVTETVFAWPGLGRLLIQAVAYRDFPVIQGAVLLLGSVFIVGNLLVDLLYAYLNPRIRYWT